VITFLGGTVHGVVVKRAFVSLSYPNYRLWFTGQLISMTGTWMQNTAQAYLAFELTKSPAFLGMMAFAQGVPTYAGAIVDRVSRRQILIVSQLFMMSLAILMAFLTWLDRLQPWHILILASLTGVANSFDAPARQSLASELVEKKDLTNALALNGALFNLGSTVGPALAGIIYVVSGPIVCFVLNAISFLAVLIALAKIKLPPKIRRKSEETIIAKGRCGLRSNPSCHWRIDFFGWQYESFRHLGCDYFSGLGRSSIRRRCAHCRVFAGRQRVGCCFRRFGCRLFRIHHGEGALDCNRSVITTFGVDWFFFV
jgi:MFS family permease